MKMCIGSEEDHHHEKHNTLFSCNKYESAGSSFTSCELCNSRASLYCQADNAFLCRKCDRWVHGANFLARRHIRCLLCTTCRTLTQRYLVGISTQVTLPAAMRLIMESSANNNTNILDTEKNSRAVKEPFLFL